MDTKIYEIAGGIRLEFNDIAKAKDSKVIGEGDQSWVADSTISVGAVDIDRERERVTMLLEVMPNQYYYVAIHSNGLEVWDDSWDTKLYDINFEGVFFSATNISRFYASLLWGIAVNLRELVTA